MFYHKVIVGTGKYIHYIIGISLVVLFDENGASSILILERETGVSKDVLEYLLADGVLVEPAEASYTKACSRCGYPIESGRYCKACMIEMAKELAGALDADRKIEPKRDAAGKDTGARMHLYHKRKT